MPEFILTSLPGIIIMLVATLIGAVAYRRNNTKQLIEMRSQLIDTYKAQVELQEKQIKALEKKVTHLNRVMMTVEYALKRRGLRIEIDDEAITLIDERSRANQTVQIKMMDSIPPEDDKEAQ